ncbi:MAG TPA: insulinase family protein [Phycisphaerales bacterium]|nr:insulinase family protein [Phycisphaerales bacterium]
MHTNSLNILLAGSLLATLTWAGPAMAQPLEQRDDIVVGTLDNGLHYIVMQHDNPPDRAAMYLHISTGSLNETDDIRGISHYLEHMAFNGSEHFAPGELIPFFESLGLTFGVHQNAFTSFDQTTYILELPDARQDTIEKGMLFFSDIAFGLTLSQEEIDNERGVILEEKRTRLGPQQRVQEEMFKILAPGSTFGQRLPIGVEETINSVNAPDFRQYVDTWYVPSNMTLMVVADTDPSTVIPVIEERFGRGSYVEKPVDLDIHLTPYSEMRAAVITDDELTDSSVQIINIRKPHDPVTTKETFRRSLIENLASGVFNRRLSRKIDEGKLSMLSGSAFAADLFNALRVSFVSADGKPEDWKKLLDESTTELRRAKLHGFTSREIEDMRTAMLSGAEQAAAMESTMPDRAFLGQFNSAVASGSTILSAAERLELTKELLPTITDEEVNTEFNDMFEDEKVLVMLAAPTSVEDVPSDSELLALAHEALAATPEADTDYERPATLMSELPEAGTVTDLARHEATDVWSAWLSNGVRVHYRNMDYHKNTATITITLAGGQILENAANRGVTEVAALAFNKPATRHLTSTNVSDLMIGKKAGVGGGAGPDAMFLSVSGNPEDFEPALQLAHLLLTEPVIEQTTLDQWREEQRQAIEQRRTQPIARLQELIPETIAPEGEARLRPIPESRIESITIEEAQAWLDNTVRNAPIEVSIVGDIDKDTAFELVARYLGSLPDRERITDETYDNLRNIQHPAGPLTVADTLDTQTQMAITVAGAFGPDHSDIRDVRLINMATQILSTRMIKEIRENQQLVYSISAMSRPSTAYPGFGLIFAAGPCKPGNEGKLGDEIQRMFAEFADNGPSDEEIEVARGQIFNTLDEQLKEPSYWSGTLEDMTYRGTSLDDVAAIEDDYSTFTADEVKAAFAKYYTPENLVTVSVAPKPAEDE